MNIILTISNDGKIIPSHIPVRFGCKEYNSCIQRIVERNLLITDEIIPDLDVRQKDISKTKNFIHEEIVRGEEFYVLGNIDYLLVKSRKYVNKIHVIYYNYSDERHTEGVFDFSDYPDFVLTQKIGNYTEISYQQFCKTSHGERQYLDIMKDILENGEKRTGRNGDTLSSFVNHMKFDLREGFPLLTTKKMFFRGIVEELLFFIKGKTDSTELEEKGVKIWKGNTSAEFLKEQGLDYAPGVMGPMYGYQWRFYDGEYDVDERGRPYDRSEVRDSIDQLANVIDLLKNNPTSRRILMTSFNPKQVGEGVLYPCHSIVLQFYVQDGYLDMFCYNRSQDFLLGVPFNIASSSLLQIIIAKITNLTPRYFNMSMGDTHIYDSHIEAVKTQLDRCCFKFCNVDISKELGSVDDLDELEYNDFILSGYNSHPSIKAKMVA